MTLAKRAAAAVLAAFVAGCSTMEVTSDHDPQADFSSLARYDWLPEPQKPTGDPRIDDNTLLDRRIRRAVDAELAAKGFEKSPADPDFLVGYHVSLDTRRSVQVLNAYYGYAPGWGYHYGAGYRPYAWPGPAETWVYEYEEGTLVLDVVTPGERHLIWRGAARDEVHFKSTPEESEARIREAVARMLERFPPAT